MKFCIVGAGAIGGLIGARLAVAGHEVALVARGEHLSVIRLQGLTYRAPDGSETRLRLSASDRPEDFGRQDAVFIALKAHSIAPMLPRLRPLLAADTPVITAINGLPWWYFYGEGSAHEGSRIECLDPEDAMRRALDASHLVGCVVHAAAEVTAPGTVHHTGGRDFILGEIDGSASERIQSLAGVVNGADLSARVTTRIRDEIWTKLIGNLSVNPISALTGARIGEVLDNPELCALARAMMAEGMRVAEAYGARIAVTIDQRIELGRKVGGAKTSMLQDIEKGRPLELDAIVSAVVELGRRAGVETPNIVNVAALIRAREKHTVPPA
ncbi:MAG: 2-dehydropantoate 2-reductase [Betaproteobacteria bacterium]|jgi:2-dehydropantoate 2-reductase|nr:2-dehydropantoate 2-reductase [Betaproteobacteria bacterium]